MLADPLSATAYNRHANVPGRLASAVIRIDRLHRRAQNRAIRALDDLGMRHQTHRPGRIVISAKTGIRIHLLLEQDLRQTAVRLISFDHERTRRKRAFVQLQLG